MGKVKREVTIEGEGDYLTAAEIMVACAQVPDGLVPTVEISLGGKIKRMKFKIEVVPDAQ